MEDRVTRFRSYAPDGVFTQALQQIQAHADAAGREGGLISRTNRTITPSADPEAA
ncbi:hypothetical protein ABT301_25885 [Streptomyces sp. NPDC000987]|uniref:hypothetical protein n=1 Tax=Streptomyces sp. NPDC000987 TaxID=3154374 RepID=UPI003316F908